MLPSYGGDWSLEIRDPMAQSVLAPTAAILLAEASSAFLELQCGDLRFTWWSRAEGRVPDGSSQGTVQYWRTKTIFIVRRVLVRETCP